MSVRVGVTGAHGFIGSHVTRFLAARGDEVLTVDRPYDRAQLTGAFRHLDAVVHLAGVVSAVKDEEFFSANVDATRIVAEAARDAGARLIQISSLAAAGPAPASSPRSEDDAPAPITTYGRSKLEGERVVAGTTGLQWTILRPGVVYGPGDRAMRPLFAYARRGVVPLVGSASAAYTFIFIDDAVAAIAAAIDGDCAGDTVFIGHEQPVTPVRLLDAIRTIAAPRALLVPIPRPLVRLGATFGDLAGNVTGRPAVINSRRYVELYSPGFVCRVDRMRERLGTVARVDLAEGLRRAGAWYSGA